MNSSEKNDLFDKLLGANRVFQDQNRVSYILPLNDVEPIEIKGEKFESRLRQFLRKYTKSMPIPADVQSFTQSLVSEAYDKGDKVFLYNRVALRNDAFWYQLGSKECPAVRIDSKGWNIVTTGIPLMFKKSERFEPQVKPTSEGADFKALLKFVNIKDADAQLLFLVGVASLIIPEIQYPAFVINGNQGSAKTTMLNGIRKLIDPSNAGPSVMSKNADYMCIQLSKSHLVTYDNLGFLKEEQSNVLCQAITGGSREARTFYTDAQTHLTNFRGAILLNGIAPFVQKSDLLSRCLLFDLKQIEQHKPESEIWKEFDCKLPSILGGLFDVISKAMQIHPTLEQDSRVSRLTDFSMWGSAIAIALGYSKDAFLDAYASNRKKGTDHAMEASPLAESVRMLMHDRDEWKDTVGKLYGELLKIRLTQNLSSRGFPNGSNHLVNYLKTFETDLNTDGITFIHGAHKNNGREITIQNNRFNP